MSVFGALNRIIARLDDAPRPQSSGGGSGDSSFGFQVLRNNSSEAPLEPWFDYIVGINGRPIDNPDPNLFANEVRNCTGKSVLMTIWSAKGQRVREMYMSIPSPPNLGLSLQWTALSATASVWHILEVAPNSPAETAGLLPYGDYIIGSPEGVLSGEAGLGELVEEFLGRPMRLYVYNHEYDVTRTLTLTPVRGWGGEGALGCVLGFGHLHQLPAPLEEGPPTAAGETMFESARLGGNAGAPAPAPPGMPMLGRTTPPPPSAQQQHDDLSGFAMSPSKAGTDSVQTTSTSNFITPADLASSAGGLAPPPQSSSTVTAGGGGTTRAAGSRRANRGKGAATAGAGFGFDEMFAEGEKRSAAVDNAPKAKGTAGLPPPPKAQSPATILSPIPSTMHYDSRMGTPKPETRSPDPITEDDDD